MLVGFWFLLSCRSSALYRGPARTLAANACLLVHAVLGELGSGRWAKSAGVLHAAVDCLKHALKLTGSGLLGAVPLMLCMLRLLARLRTLLCNHKTCVCMSSLPSSPLPCFNVLIAGALALCAGEALLPLQACVTLLGPRLKLAALEGILLICTRAMQRRWAGRAARYSALL